MAFEFNNEQSRAFREALRSGLNGPCRWIQREVSIDVNPWSAGGGGNFDPGTGWPDDEGGNAHINSLNQAIDTMANSIFDLRSAPSKAMAELVAQKIRADMDIVEGLLVDYIDSLK